MLFFTAIALLSSLQPSMAHLPLAYEPERFRQVTNNAAGSWAASDRSVEDFSLESPFDIYDSLYKTLFEFEPAIGRNPSSALFVPSRLIDENDVDYYMYDTTNSNVKEAESSGIYPEMYNFVSSALNKFSSLTCPLTRRLFCLQMQSNLHRLVMSLLPLARSARTSILPSF